jgi:CrcB protein
MNPALVMSLSSILLVALGGALGCVARFLAIHQIMRLNPTAYPVGTMFVNVVGSCIIGYVMAKYGAQDTARLFFVTGVLGGFTTFSAFSWDVLQLVQRGEWMAAGMYILGSVVLSLGAVAIGAQMGR